MNGNLVEFKIDNGANTTVMKEETFSELHPRPRLIISKLTVYSPGGKVWWVGKFLANTTYNGQKYQYSD